MPRVAAAGIRAGRGADGAVAGRSGSPACTVDATVTRHVSRRTDGTAPSPGPPRTGWPSAGRGVRRRRCGGSGVVVRALAPPFDGAILAVDAGVVRAAVVGVARSWPVRARRTRGADDAPAVGDAVADRGVGPRVRRLDAGRGAAPGSAVAALRPGPRGPAGRAARRRGGQRPVPLPGSRPLDDAARTGSGRDRGRAVVCPLLRGRDAVRGVRRGDRGASGWSSSSCWRSVAFGRPWRG